MHFPAELPRSTGKKFEWHLWNLNPLKFWLDALARCCMERNVVNAVLNKRQRLCLFARCALM